MMVLLADNLCEATGKQSKLSGANIGANPPSVRGLFMRLGSRREKRRARGRQRRREGDKMMREGSTRRREGSKRVRSNSRPCAPQATHRRAQDQFPQTRQHSTGRGPRCKGKLCCAIPWPSRHQSWASEPAREELDVIIIRARGKKTKGGKRTIRLEVFVPLFLAGSVGTHAMRSSV
jgi:hypothetical protein